MGGTMWAESTGVPGEGSTFHAVIATRAAAPRAVKARTGQGTTDLDARHAATHPLKILLAEDNAVNQRFAMALLEKWGHRVVVAENGLEALRALEQGTFDVVLLDVQMPEMSGLEAAAWIRREESNSNHRVPIVALTANTTAEDRLACLHAGMDDVLPKPVSVPRLRETLARIAANTTAAAAAHGDRAEGRQP
jgi:CheY-like chemotaxis protein